jgi:hypothetical protein
LSKLNKAAEIATSFINLYGPMAEVRVAERILMFEAEGDRAALEAWRDVEEALRVLRHEAVIKRQ